MASTRHKHVLVTKLKGAGQQALKNGLNEVEVREVLLNAVTSHQDIDNSSFSLKRKKIILYSVIFAAFAIIATSYYQTWDPRCIIANNLLMLELARPAVSCDVCKDMQQVATVDGETFSKEQFLANYAYNGIPLLVKGGARNWTALTTFNFNYLRDLYQETEGALDAVQNDCQFFPYKSDFLTLAQVFEMSEARSRIDPGEKQWYVGW